MTEPDDTDRYQPPDAERSWSFNADVARVFDDMLERSIPQYQVMREAVTELALPSVRPYAPIVDLGCSRGGALAPFVERFGVANRYHGVDASGPMVACARERFASVPPGIVDIQLGDLRRSYPDCGAACVTLAVLTLQFVPINYRQRIIRQVYDHTLDGGAFVFVEKVLGASAALDERFVSVYHQHKALNGYTAEDIARKAAALEGVLVPVTAALNEAMLHAEGFRYVDCFWRYLNFAGWIAIK